MSRGESRERPASTVSFRQPSISAADSVISSASPCRWRSAYPAETQMREECWEGIRESQWPGTNIKVTGPDLCWDTHSVWMSLLWGLGFYLVFGSTVYFPFGLEDIQPPLACSLGLYRKKRLGATINAHYRTTVISWTHLAPFPHQPPEPSPSADSGCASLLQGLAFLPPGERRAPCLRGERVPLGLGLVGS